MLNTSARLDATSQNYDGMKSAVGQLQDSGQTDLAVLEKQAADIEEVQGALEKYWRVFKLSSSLAQILLTHCVGEVLEVPKDFRFFKHFGGRQDSNVRIKN